MACSETRVGFAFNNPDINNNYHAPGWGLLCSPDTLRYDEMFGNALIAESDSQSITDEQLLDYSRIAIRFLEVELNIDILPRRIRYEDGISEDGTVDTRTDYDDSTYVANMTRKQLKELYIREQGYKFDIIKARKQFRVKFRRRPVKDILTANLVDPYFGNTVIDLMPFRIVKKGYTGVTYFQPRLLTSRSNSFQMLWRYYLYPSHSMDYQRIFLLDYETGYENCQDVPDELRNIVKKLAAVTLMNIYGDGKLAAIAARSVNLNSVSESISTTLSASVDKNSVVSVRNIKTKKIKKYKINKLYNKKNNDKFNPIEYEVLSVNPDNINEVRWKELKDVVEHIVPVKNKYWIKTKRGNIGVTEDHSLFLCKNNKLLEVKGRDLKSGDSISIILNGIVQNTMIKSIKQYDAGSKVYDLSVKDFENFIVNGNIISHNTSATFGARIIQYQKEIKEWFKQNRSKYSRTSIGRLG